MKRSQGCSNKKHGFSEYTKRRQDGEYKGNQESAFNYRKQTLNDDEVTQELNSPPEAETVTSKVPPGLSVDRKLQAMLAPNQVTKHFATPSVIGSERGGSEVVPTDFLAETKVTDYMKEKSHLLAMKVDPTGAKIPVVQHYTVALQKLDSESIVEEADQYATIQIIARPPSDILAADNSIDPLTSDWMSEENREARDFRKVESNVVMLQTPDTPQIQFFNG